LISPGKKLSISEQCEVLGIPRSTFYYTPKEGESERNLEIMAEIDRANVEHPAMGVRQMVDYLKSQGFMVGRKLVRRLMALMDIRAIYPQKSLSKGGWVKYRMPYLLRNMRVSRANQVWSIDISYVAMEHGFMYLYAIIDVYSRYIVGWGLYNTLDAANAIAVLKDAVCAHETPEIINSDQGCQFTCADWHKACDTLGIKISMDGKARCLDNIWIERFWRTIKREYIYLNPVETTTELRNGIRDYIGYYNARRFHQGIGHKTPSSMYYAVAA